MRILVTSDGSDTLQRAADFTTLFASGADITLLSVFSDDEEREASSEAHSAAAEDLEASQETEIESIVRAADVGAMILEEVDRQAYDLVVLGVHLHRKLNRLRPKSLAKFLAGRLSVPLLVVFPAWQRLERILVWTAGEEPDELALRLAGELAAEVGAEVTVLHVMSQVPLSADANVRDLERDANSLMEHRTREGEFLQGALDILDEVGVPPSKCEVKVRHGLTVEEIIGESEEGDFDLIVVGGLHVPSKESWHELRELVQEDLAERVLMESSRPVLIAREPESGVDWSDF